MSRFYYEAIDREGRRLPGLLDCEGEDTLHQVLGAKGLTLVSVSTRPPGQAARAKRTLRRGGVSAQERAAFARQLARLMDSGCPMDKALALVARTAQTQALAGALAAVSVDVEQGATLHDALARHPRAFPPLFVASVLAGEAGGFLAGALAKLAEFEANQARLAGKVKHALVYPVFMAITTAVCLGVIFTFVVPTLISFFEKSNMELPLPTQVLIALSHNFGTIAAALALGGAGLWMARARALKRPAFREAEDRVLLSLPVVGHLNATLMLGRFTRIMALLLGGGVALTRALSIAREAFTNRVFLHELDLVCEQVTGGEALSRCLELSPVFPEQVAGEVRFGEETGSLAKAFENLAGEYESAAEGALESMVALVEPLIIVVMGGVMGFVVISVFLPMITMVNRAE